MRTKYLVVFAIEHFSFVIERGVLFFLNLISELSKARLMPFIDYNSKQIIKIWDGISGTIAHSDQGTYCRFTIENGTLLPVHSHVHEQWCHVLEGQLEFDIDGEKQLLTAGMAAFIPSWAPHSAVALTECKVLDCFTPVREDFRELEKSNS